MCRRWLVMMMVTMMVTLVVVAETVRGLNCVCNPRECEALEPSGCPGRGVILLDACGCCEVCARTIAEDCGEFKGTCEPGLECISGSCKPKK